MRRAIAVGIVLVAAACSNTADEPTTTSFQPPTVAATTVPTDTTAPKPPLSIDVPSAIDVAVSPEDDLAALVEDSPEGTVFLIKAGVHHIEEIVPKNGMGFHGEPGAVLSGARVLTDWSEDGGRWIIGGQTQQGKRHGNCVEGYSGCVFPEDLYIDDTMLWQVTSRDELAPGTWFFDYESDRIEMVDDPRGRIVEVSVTRSAFSGTAIEVTISGLVIEKFANQAQRGAVHGMDGTNLGAAWRVSNNEVRFNHGVGIRIGDEGLISGNYVHHNGHLGLSGTGQGLVVEGNEIAYNNTAGFAPGWSGGGTKFFNTVDLVVRENFSHHNIGPGLWTDINNIGTLYENNTVAHNTRAGIVHEISYQAIIRGNTAFDNGDRENDEFRGLRGSGILVSTSSDVEVYDNVVTNNQNGITGVEQDRGDGTYGPHELRNLWVHDNTITADMGRAAGVGSRDDDVFSQNNRFDNNTYTLGEGVVFGWQGAKTWSEWQAVGQDENGALIES